MVMRCTLRHIALEANAIAGTYIGFIAGDQPRRRDDGDAGPRELDEQIDVRPVRHADDAVGAQVDQRPYVVRGDHAHSRPTSQHARVLADLLGAISEDVDQLEARIIEDRAQCGRTNDPSKSTAQPAACSLVRP
jgi:hypothetical protein